MSSVGINNKSTDIEELNVHVPGETIIEGGSTIDEDDLVSIQETLDKVDVPPHQKNVQSYSYHQEKPPPNYLHVPPQQNAVYPSHPSLVSGTGIEIISTQVQGLPQNTLLPQQQCMNGNAPDNSGMDDQVTKLVKWIISSFRLWKTAAFVAITYLIVTIQINLGTLSNLSFIPAALKTNPLFVLFVRAVTTGLAAMFFQSAFRSQNM